jgi:hypothetical protein
MASRNVEAQRKMVNWKRARTNRPMGANGRIFTRLKMANAIPKARKERRTKTTTTMAKVPLLMGLPKKTRSRR